MAAIVRDRVLSVVTATTSMAQVGAGALPVIVAAMSDRQHNPALAGVLLTAFAAGGLAGSLAWTWRPGSPTAAPVIVMVALVGVGLPLAIAATATAVTPVLVTLFALSGTANGPLFGALLAARQQQAPRRVRSQVFTIGAGAKITASAGGAALAGVLAGTPTALQLVLAAGCSITAGLTGAVLLRPWLARHIHGPNRVGVRPP
jgi:hypothetical protein